MLHYGLFNKGWVQYILVIQKIHHIYKLLSGDKEPYDEYVKLMDELGRAKSGYMNSSEYLEFYSSFDYLGPMYTSEYIYVKNIGHRYESWDGDHRLACLMKQKIIKLKLKKFMVNLNILDFLI